MPSQHILLIDDNPFDAELTVMALGEATIGEIKVLDSGPTALTYLESLPSEGLPDLILLDLNMPKMNGFEVLEALQADQRTKSIPVIMLSTSNADRDIQRACARGASAYIVKPMDMNHFHETLVNVAQFWLRLKRQQEAKQALDTRCG